jgi:hypothetical protein
MQNDACTGGDQQACRFRDAQLLTIESQGWCLSDAKKWQPAPCKPTAQVAEEDPKVFVDRRLKEACENGLEIACNVLKEKPSSEHAMNVEEFMKGICEVGKISEPTPDTTLACEIQDAIGKDLNARGYQWNDGSDAQGSKVAAGYWELVPKPSAEIQKKPSAEVQKMMDQEEALNDKCRDGVTDSQGNTDQNLTQKVCATRDEILNEIKTAGWSWGHEGQVGADRTWEQVRVK